MRHPQMLVQIRRLLSYAKVAKCFWMDGDHVPLRPSVVRLGHVGVHLRKKDRSTIQCNFETFLYLYLRNISATATPSPLPLSPVVPTIELRRFGSSLL